MYFLACNKCKHLNEVKTEHLTFCKKCGSKLTNNYRSWKEKNGHKSFMDYKQEVCIDQNQHRALESKKQKGQNHMKKSTILGIVFGAILILAISTLIPKIIPLLMQPQMEALANNEWKRVELGNIGLSIESPITLHKDTTIMSVIPDNVKEVILSAETFCSNKNFKKVLLMVNSFEYRADIPLSLEGAAQGALQNMQQQVGASNFSHEQKEIYLNDIPGIELKGNYKEAGITYGYYMHTYVQKSTMWQVVLKYDKSEEQGPIIAKRIIDSIQINS